MFQELDQVKELLCEMAGKDGLKCRLMIEQNTPEGIEEIHSLLAERILSRDEIIGHCMEDPKISEGIICTKRIHQSRLMGFYDAKLMASAKETLEMYFYHADTNALKYACRAAGTSLNLDTVEMVKAAVNCYRELKGGEPTSTDCAREFAKLLLRTLNEKRPAR